MAKKRGLGKGVDAVFGGDAPETVAIAEDISLINDNSKEKVSLIKLSKIEPNKEQPRKAFDKEKLEALAASIKEHGVIQPVIVKDLENGFYMIVAGERRWRAARMAGLKEIPAIIRSYGELETMQVALIENLQRENLNPIEEAMSYKTLIDDFSLTQEQLSEQVGKSRSAIANSIRLLSLSDEIKAFLENGKLSGGHARAILSVDSDEKKLSLAQKIISSDLSVRQAENEAKLLNKKKEKKEKKTTEFDIQIGQIEKQLSEVLGTKVKILSGQKKGRIEIEYYSKKDFDRVLKLLNI